ncbi:MAG: ankyrin repeat domain-containing protein [Proteobacteria bacterium]|nr:ankyrin repeat domain-containing protein [Pseudomonadota bacterium]MBU1741514.1 ankyrin repeat domain-containing protein [Pseudomonadota bacterium]
MTGRTKLVATLLPVILAFGAHLGAEAALAAGGYCPGTDPRYMPPALRWIRERSVGPSGRPLRTPAAEPRPSGHRFSYPSGKLQALPSHRSRPVFHRRRRQARPGRKALKRRLFIAAKKGDLRTVRRLLAKRPKLVNIRDVRRYTPLLWAARRNHSGLVRYLLVRGADPSARNRWGNTALHWAAYNGHARVAARLIRARAQLNGRETEKGHTPLHDAAWKGRRRIVTLLLRAGARADLTNKAGRTAAQVARQNNHLAVADLIQAWVRRAASPKARPAPTSGKTARILALARAGDVAGLKAMIEAHPRLVNAQGKNGYTPLIRAARAGRLAAVQLLLAKGAAVNAANKWQNTALHWAAYNGHHRVVTLLLRHRARLDVREKDKGHTPLHDAAWKGRWQVVRLLLEAGADPGARSREGLTPLEVALRHHRLAVAELIGRYGGR